jgi:CRP-like cAMP-binding protein/cytochrome P450
VQAQDAPCKDFLFCDSIQRYAVPPLIDDGVDFPKPPRPERAMNAPAQATESSLPRNSKLPPLSSGLPILGCTLDLLKDASGFLLSQYQKLGPVFRVAAFGKEYTVMAGREALQFFTQVGERHFSRETFYRRFAQELGAKQFILGAQGAQHARLRKMMKLGFSRQVAAGFVPSMVKAVEERVREWHPGQKLGVMDATAELAFECYALVMAGRSLRDDFRAANIYSNTIMKVGAMVRPALLLHIPPYQGAKRHIFSMMKTLVSEHRADADHPTRECDLLDTLLIARDPEGRLIPETDLVATALYGFVGTLVYINRVLSYLLFEILRDPSLLEKITVEADAVLGSPTLDVMTLQRMSTLYSAFLENMRFHPVALGLPFFVEEDFEFQGCLIKKGQKVVLTPLPVHFSARHYSNPNCFDHARCAEPRHEQRAPGAFAPFGFAGRVCAAVGLVETITMVVIATLLRNVHLQIEPPKYQLRTSLDPLPGPESSFRMSVLNFRTAPALVQALPRIDDRLTGTLPGLGSHELNQIVSAVKPITYAAGSLIIREGDTAEEFFIVLEGQVEVAKELHVPDEKQIVLSRLGPGAYFGEIGLLRGIKRTASVRAVTDVTVLVLNRETFITIVSECDLVSAQIADMVRQRVMATRLAETLPRLSPQQVARYLPNFKLIRYESGEAIVRQGEPADMFYILTMGRAEVMNHRPSEEDLVLAQLDTGEWFGEMGLLLGSPRTATVRALGKVEVMALDRKNFQALMADSDPSNSDVSSVMFQRLISPWEKMR